MQKNDRAARCQGVARSVGAAGSKGVAHSANGVRLALAAALALAALVPAAAQAPANPIETLLDSYKVWIIADEAANARLADNIITWQFESGGFTKAMEKSYAAPWDGKAPKSTWQDGANGNPLATIDNNATVSEILFLNHVYGATKGAAYKAAAARAFEFLLALQYPSGGFAQVLPRRVDLPYSNMATFNDNATIRVLRLFDLASREAAPFVPGFVDPALRARLAAALERGVGFILKAQIVSGGKKTVWCAQHDPASYAPVGARSYELPSKSGSESVSITAFLLTRPRTPAIDAAVNGALAWFRANRVAGLKYNKKGPEMFVKDETGVLWYRFYDLDVDRPFFAGRDGVKKYDIMEIEEERRLGYSWAGDYASKLLAYAASLGR